METRSGFTLIELLITIAIIGILSLLGLVSYTASLKRARDARRLSNIREIKTALEIYRDTNGVYPGNTDNDCSGWDAGFNGGPASGDPFIQELQTGGYITKVPGDPVATDNCGGYAYYRYSAGSYGCDTANGAYYVLGIRDLENVTGIYPDSPGWKCLEKDWHDEFEWVTGSFE